VKRKMAMAPEPKGKLGAAAVVVVNGPEGEILDWGAVEWRVCEESVRRLRQRIFTASKAGDLKRVRSLQRLLLRSRANTLLSVRRVSERNTGRVTAGVDGEVALTPRARMQLAHQVQREAASWRARPVRRVYVPKRQGSGKRRPLGIPVIVDRVHQARVVSALEPEWEARFEARSYGFRPGRGCHDAIEAIYRVARGANPKRRWVLDADLAAAFDRINHDHILAMIGTFPARGLIREWLKSGVVEDGHFTPTEEGTPQGGVISPVLLNIALHGMEQAAGVRYRTSASEAGKTVTGSPVLVRYADDLVVLCHTRRQAIEVKARLAEWLASRGLAFNEDKTRLVTLEEGFDFLGFNVRRYRGKLLVKPSKAAIRRVRERLRTEMRSLRGANAAAVLKRLTPIIRGWAAYYRSAVSSETFKTLDDYLWKLTYKWASYNHSNKPRFWVSARYFGMFNPSRRDRWVFGDRESGAYLPKFAWTRIVRHRMVKGTASPDDHTLAAYWAERRARTPPPTAGKATWRLYQTQDGRCLHCGDWLLHAEDPPQTPREWEQWLSTSRPTIVRDVEQKDDTPDEQEPRLIHTHCRTRHTNERRQYPGTLHSHDPTGLA
jgi:RNA-directed DNA polymerase